MKTAIITGGASGIGEATVKLFQETGWKTIILDIQDPKDEKSEYVYCDVKNAQQVTEAFSKLATPDVVVHSAGVYKAATLDESSADEIAETCRVNLEGTIYVNQSAVAKMRDREGVIVNISSALALISDPTSPVYSATKAAIVSLTKTLAQTYAPAIRINAVLPGPVDTPLLRKAFDANEDLDNYKKLNPLQRFAIAEEIAQAILFLIENKYCTGTILQVDGGEGSTSMYSS